MSVGLAAKISLHLTSWALSWSLMSINSRRYWSDPYEWMLFWWILRKSCRRSRPARSDCPCHARSRLKQKRLRKFGQCVKRKAGMVISPTGAGGFIWQRTALRSLCSWAAVPKTDSSETWIRPLNCGKSTSGQKRIYSKKPKQLWLRANARVDKYGIDQRL